MKIIKIVTSFGYFTVGYEGVTDIQISENNENHYVVYRKPDSFNKGSMIEIKCENVLVYWD